MIGAICLHRDGFYGVVSGNYNRNMVVMDRWLSNKKSFSRVVVFKDYLEVLDV